MPSFLGICDGVSYPDVHDVSLRMQVIIANANNIADSRRGGAPPVSAPDLPISLV